MEINLYHRSTSHEDSKLRQRRLKHRQQTAFYGTKIYGNIIIITLHNMICHGTSYIWIYTEYLQSQHDV